MFTTFLPEALSEATTGHLQPDRSGESRDTCELDLEEGLPVEEVHRRACAARKNLGRAQRALSFWLLEMDGRQLYRHFGCSSVFHYGELFLELAPHTIAEYLRSGREMARLPLLAAACGRGELSPSKIREISRVATPETEEAWLSIARSSTYRQIEKLVPLTPRGGLPPAGEIRAKSTSPQNLTLRAEGGRSDFSQPRHPSGSDKCRHTRDGHEVSSCECTHEEYRSNDRGEQPGEREALSPMDEKPGGENGHIAGPARYHTKLVLELENERMAIINKALEKARKDTGEKERGALIEHIARVFLVTSEHGPGNATPYRITLHHIPESDVAWIEGTSGPHYVEESALHEALCDAEILDLGEAGKESAKTAPGGPACDREKDHERHGPRLRRTIPPTLRRQVLERDGRRCSVPGCGMKSFLSLHHIKSIADAGKDRAGNLTTTCWRCHRALHKDMLSVEGEAPGALLWKNRWGAPLNGGAFRSCT